MKKLTWKNFVYYKKYFNIVISYLLVVSSKYYIRQSGCVFLYFNPLVYPVIFSLYYITLKYLGSNYILY